jgi:hypothetical protein
MDTVIDIAQIVTALAAVTAVLTAVWVARETLERHDRQLEQHVGTEGTALCIAYREHVLLLHRKYGMTEAQIRELLIQEGGMAAPDGRLMIEIRDDEREGGCAPIGEIIRLAGATSAS